MKSPFPFFLVISADPIFQLQVLALFSVLQAQFMILLVFFLVVESAFESQLKWHFESGMKFWLLWQSWRKSIYLKPILIGCKSHPMRDLGITLAPHFPVVRLAVVDPMKLATGSIEQPPPQISWNRRWSYTLRAPMAFPVESKTGSHRNFDFNWLPVSQSIHALWWEGRL